MTWPDAYVLTVMADGMSVQAKVFIAAGLGILAFAASVWAAGRQDAPSPTNLTVGSNLKGSEANLEDISITDATGKSAQVASSIEATGKVSIKNIRVDSSQERPK